MTWTAFFICVGCALLGFCLGAVLTSRKYMDRVACLNPNTTSRGALSSSTVVFRPGPRVKYSDNPLEAYVQGRCDEIRSRAEGGESHERSQAKSQSPGTVHVTEASSGWEEKRERLLDAIAIVESNNDDEAVGDGGRSFGAYQITFDYLIDACEWHFENHHPGEPLYPVCGVHYTDMLKDPAFSRRVIAAYMQRYCPDAWNGKDDHEYCMEVISRIHNGGPKGAVKDSTLPYWHRMQTQLALEKAAR